jgi:hypothetical protein
MPAEHASYLAKYLSKERPECLKRWRLWASFGEGWDPTKVKNLVLIAADIACGRGVT